MFEARAQYSELKMPQPQNRLSSDWAADADDADCTFDLAAAYLLQQAQNGHAHLRIATSLLDQRAPDFGLAFANIGATRRTLERISRYRSNVGVGLECNGAQDVDSAHKQLSKQYRETLKRYRNVCKWHRQRFSVGQEYPALI